MEIEVGEYVRTIDGFVGIFDRYSKRPDTSIYKSPFNCFIKLQNRKTPLQCHRNYIVNHNKDIKKLIEVKDVIKINNEKYEVIYDKSYGKLGILIPNKEQLAIRHCSLEYIFSKQRN